MEYKSKESFKLLFKTFYNPLCNFAFSFLKDKALSEDAVQEVFTKLWDRKDQYDIDSIKSYLFQSTKHKAIEILRKNQNLKLYQQELARLDADKYNIEDESDKFMLKEKLFDSIRQLPPKCREIFVLSKVNGLTYSEIADELQISKKTVENQIGIALRLLRTKLV